MNTSSGELLPNRLRTLRRRLISQLFLERSARALLVAAGAAVLLSGWEWWANALIDWRMAAAVLLVLAFIWAALATWLRAPSRESVAALLDRLGNTRDRWITALAFRSTSDPVARAAAAECEASLARRDFRPLLPWRIPRAAAWIIAPLLSLALLQWSLRSNRIALAVERATAKAAVAPTVAQLDRLADTLKSQPNATATEELRKIAEQLQRSAERLRAEAKSPDAAERAALRELSALEQMVQDMQRESRNLTKEELEALAKALEQQDATREAAEALQAGKAEDAAKALEEAAQKLAEKQDPDAAEQMKQTLDQALERLAQQKQLSQAMQQLAQQLAQQGGQGAMNQLLQKLAQMLRQMPRDGGGQQPGKAGQQQSAQQTLQALLSALQNMKQGQSPGQLQPGQQPGAGQVLVQSFGGDEQSTQLLREAQAPTGRPGTEYDRGTTETPFGNERSEMADKGGELSLRGQLGEGESLSQMLPTAGANDKARRRYQELYQAMAPAASDALQQENIPLGSRFFIKRYFESIRPPE